MTGGTARGTPQAMPLRVTTAAEAAARDQAAIAAGASSFALMLQAGTQSAAAILREHADRLAWGVDVFAGIGNNGGDAAIVAAQLARAGVRVRLTAVGAPRTDDARRARAVAEVHGVSVADPAADASDSARVTPRVVVDGLLGTGHRGPLRPEILARTALIAAARGDGARVVALDVPSGLDATTGAVADGAVVADATHTYGTVKRGVLFARPLCGRVLLLDIGLADAVALPDPAWETWDGARLAACLPPIAWDAHKRRRGHLALVGGAFGMTGAIVLATRAALRSGIGLARGVVEAAGVAVLHSAVPQAVVRPWDTMGTSATPWGDALAIGPGLGRTDTARALLRQIRVQHPSTPVVLDADALTLLAESAPADGVAAWTTGGRSVVCTPHPGEFARLIGAPCADAWDARAQQLEALAARTGATVLLKGTPTLVATSGRRLTVVAHGTPALGTGGSGDILTGIIGTLLAQGASAHEAAVLGATVHGGAAEVLAEHGQSVRGTTLDDILGAMPDAWARVQRPTPQPPGVLASWPALERA